jgi:GDP-L-fucose synthase
MKFSGDIIWDTYQPDGQLRKPSDNKKIKKYLPDFKFTPLEQGIKETVKHFTDNYEKIRK